KRRAPPTIFRRFGRRPLSDSRTKRRRAIPRMSRGRSRRSADCVWAPLDAVEADVLSSARGVMGRTKDDSDGSRRSVRHREVPNLFVDDEGDEPTRGGGAAVHRIRLDEEIEAIDDEPTGRFVPLRIRAAGRTDEGTRRPNNEDALLLLDGSSVFAVAD